MYRVVPRPGGESEYVEAELGLAYHELNDGTFIAVRDTEVAVAQRSAGSHQRYFEHLKKSDDPKEVRRTLKKQDALQRQLEQLALDRVAPPSGPQVEFIKDERFMDLRLQYAKAVSEGCAKDCEFQPITAYQHKLMTRSGKMIRPLYQGEVGMLGSVILCLEPGYGVGSSAAVGVELSSEDEG